MVVVLSYAFVTLYTFYECAVSFARLLFLGSSGRLLVFLGVSWCWIFYSCIWRHLLFLVPFPVLGHGVHVFRLYVFCDVLLWFYVSVSGIILQFTLVWGAFQCLLLAGGTIFLGQGFSPNF